jgi:3-deoxy-manno-octulosonate cytidylyltransferase (CMP-KDO synthetase)
MKIACIIPARLGSYRFNDKPLEKICGKPMIEHVYKRAKMSDLLSEVYVATPNVEIKNVVEGFGGVAIMTSDSARRASDRVAEAARDIDADIIIDLQGDEPLVNPDMISLSVQPMMEDKSVECVCLARKVDHEAAKDRNDVKVAFDKNNDALFFSREPIPSMWLGDKQFPYYVTVCVMPYTKKSLEKYASLESTPLEIIESIDMFRFLENGYRIRIVESPYETYSVDVPEDVQKVERVMSEDKLWLKY